MKFAFASALLAAAVSADEMFAYCVIGDPTNTNSVMGLAKLYQASDDDQMVITAKVSGLNADQQHGFHVHANGFTNDDCTTSGGHFNPFEVNHGKYDNAAP